MFKTGIVLYYVKEYSQNEVESIKNFLKDFVSQDNLVPKILNSDVFNVIAENLPIGTIICKSLSSRAEEHVICLPMFSSHVSLPIKTGEKVWFFTNNDRTFNSAVEESAPLLSVRNYWLSRKIGMKVSEDLNYTHYNRDAIISEETTGNAVFKLPEISTSSIYNTFGDSDSDSPLKNYLKSKERKDFFPAASPRWHSKPYELTFQGSNNSLINLTNSNNNESIFRNKGAIDIVAGRHLIRSFKKENENNSINLGKKPVNVEEDLQEDAVLSKNSFLKIQNTENDDEVIKNQKLYMDSGIDYIDESIEGKVSKFNDASRFYISEYDMLDNNYFNTSFMIDQAILEKKLKKASPYEVLLGFTSASGNSDIDSNSKVKSFVINSIEPDFLKPREIPIPSVLLKSNDIRIVSRKSSKKDEETFLPSGTIRIIKESEESQEYAHICLEEDGQVAIDGKSVLLGNFNKVFERFLASSETDVDRMHGNGDGVLIGYDPTLSEPLVLGSTLESIIKELIHINIDLVEQVKKLSEDITNHTHSGVMPGGGITLPSSKNPATQSSTINANNFANLSIGPKSGDQNHDVLTKRYENIQNNLYKMLSRFAKSS
tara:strand:- start:1898 stop:3700 length:1803 start_codon:yes stop_codon:yes gene_type:complete